MLHAALLFFLYAKKRAEILSVSVPSFIIFCFAYEI